MGLQMNQYVSQQGTMGIRSRNSDDLDIGGKQKKQQRSVTFFICFQCLIYNSIDYLHSTMVKRCLAIFLPIFLSLCLNVNAIHLRRKNEDNTNGKNIDNIFKKKYSNLSQASQRLYEILEEDNGVKIAALLLDQEGRVLQEARNQAVGQIGTLKKNFFKNPIRHAEEQLMFWYWENKKALNLPPPQSLTILTTLDPCLMCASTILLSGFNVGVINFDKFGGVNFKLSGFDNYQFAPKIKEKLLHKFGYYKVKGDESRQVYQYLANHTVFKDDMLQKEMQQKIQVQQQAPLQTLITQVFDENLPKESKNLRQLPQENPLVQSLKKLYSHALSMTLTDKAYKDGQESSTYQPTLQLKHHLQSLLKHTPHAKNAMALIDPYGNLLLARADRFDISPIHTAVVKAVEDYSKFYLGHLEGILKSGRDFRETDAYAYLPILLSCSFIFLNALPGDDLVSLQALTIHGYSINQARKTVGPIYINDYEPNAVTLESVIPLLPVRYGKGHFDMTPALAKITREAKRS